LGLLPALIWHFQRCKTQSDLNVDFRHSGLEINFNKDVAIAAYRIVQEALTNVMRYAAVKDVLVEVWVDMDWLHIRIEDKGKGFDSRQIEPGSSLGLQGMKERALLLGGNLTVDSSPGQGTVVFAQLPLNIEKEHVTIPGSQS
jgi:signal transduction histidine kinase